MDKEELFIKRIRELANMAYQRDITTFTDFLNLNERNILNSQNFHKLGVTAESFGGYENLVHIIMMLLIICFSCLLKKL